MGSFFVGMGTNRSTIHGLPLEPLLFFELTFMAIDTCSLEKTTDFMLHLQSNRPPYLNTYLPGWTNGPTWLDEWAPQVGRMGKMR